jgi:hypothetical protein
MANRRTGHRSNWRVEANATEAGTPRYKDDSRLLWVASRLTPVIKLAIPRGDAKIIKVRSGHIGNGLYRRHR